MASFPETAQRRARVLPDGQGEQRGADQVEGGQHPGAVHVGDELADVVVRGVRDDLRAGAHWTTRPWRITMIWSPIRIASFRSCVTKTVVRASSAWTEQQVLHVPTDQVERRERLVHEEDRRVDGERPGEADALAHPAGELVRELVAAVSEPDPVQGRVGAAPFRPSPRRAP